MIDWLTLNLKNAGLSLLWPFYEFMNDGNSRYYWLYCATGLAIALWVHLSRKETKPFGEVFFDRNTWLGRSALNDYFVLLAGSVLRVTLLASVTISAKPIAAAVVALLHKAGVTGTQLTAPALGLTLALTVSLFLVDDLLRYLVHLIMHRVPELWEYHKVHHSAEALNFATAERFHPVETVITSAGLVVGMGLVNGIFISFYGDRLTPMTVFGANAFLFVFNIAGGVLRHAPVWVSFGPTVEKWIISPAMHQIHHSDNPKHFDSNMGGSLAVWDRMFGTLYIAKDQHEITGYGIGEETPAFRSLVTLYFRPFERSLMLFSKRLGLAHDAPAAPAKITPAE